MAAVEPGTAFLHSLINRVEKVLNENHAFSIKDLAINGNDLIAIGIKPGKSLGIILNELFETVLDDPAENTHNTLLVIAEKLKNKLEHEAYSETI
jgi:poly(A) polymerase/tRNA nucleotidyltransferase (CCA-adding enzyme)